MPKISVIMGIYNCEETLAESIECILAQTERDWELILCDDGSTDGTCAIAQNYADAYPDQIRLIKNDRNRGLNYTLNRCLAAAKGKFVARMDGDDRCEPNRFALQAATLDNEPEIAFISSGMTLFDETGVWGQISPTEYPQPADFVHGTPFCHAPCMVRREAYKAVGGYTVEDRLLRVEDYHLWVKMYAAGYRGKNLRIPLYQMRDDRNACSRRKFRYRLNEAYVVALAVRKLKLPIWKYIYAARPVLAGLIPKCLYNIIHKWRLRRKKRGD